MKKLPLSLILGLLCLAPLHATALEDYLKSLPGVSGIEKLESGPFAEKYLFRVRQEVVPGDPIPGYFDQRVIVMHVGEDRPTVIITEGYNAGYGLRASYREEVSKLYNTNIVLVEHRFFDESTPSPRQWIFMRGQYAMNDLHKVRSLMGRFYPGKWIATGISKGGQTALMYRTYFPEDVDLTVAYVGPLCRAAEDGRHEPYIANRVGTPEARAKVLAFQTLALKRRDAIYPKFKAFCDTAKMQFRLPLDHIYDYCVLEYSFAFWQWGTNPDIIPNETATDSVILNHLLQIAGPDYFVRESPSSPFFVQAAKELGYYGYNTKPFKKLLHIKNAKRYLRKIFLPDSYHPRFDKKLYEKMSRFAATTDKDIIFIYGSDDPWTAAAVPNPQKPNILYMVQPGGSHRARITTLPDQMRRQVMDRIQAILDK